MQSASSDPPEFDGAAPSNITNQDVHRSCSIT